jgi:glycosyltransferase involved in cell wall biosynthesis
MVAYTHYLTDPRCRREATLAASSGWDVHFYALASQRIRRNLPCEGITLHELPMSRYRGDSTTAYLFSYFRFLCLASATLFRDHLRRPFDVIHVNTMPDFMVLTGLLPRLFGAKVILDIHDVMPEIYMTKFELPARHWKIRMIRMVEVWAARLAHRVLTAEHPKAELLVEHGIPEGKIDVLLNLPDEALFPLQFILSPDTGSETKEEFRLIYHGTIAHRLGLDQALSAIELLKDEIHPLKFEIYGEGDQLPELHRQVEKSELSALVEFSNKFQPIEEIIPAIKRAHLAVLPTRQEISTDFMLPTKLLEYLSLGVPAVFTPTRTVRHYFGSQHPLYLESAQPEEIAAKISWVKNNYAETKRLTAELQDMFFSQYRWSEHRKVYLDLLARLKGGASSRVERS